MTLEQTMKQKNFVVVGNTIDEEKYACKIKNKLIENGYNAVGVYKELKSINDVDFDIDVIDLCINPVKGLELIKENKKSFKNIVIQPGAESDELIAYLNENKLPYILGCLLVGISVYKNK